MTREDIFKLLNKHQDNDTLDIKTAKEMVNIIFDEHEAQLKAKKSDLERQDMIIKCLNIDLDNKEKLLKAKDEEIKELGEIVQQYLIPSKNYDAIIRDKDEEIERLKEHITHLQNVYMKLDGKYLKLKTELEELQHRSCESCKNRILYTYDSFKQVTVDKCNIRERLHFNGSCDGLCCDKYESKEQ